MEFGDTHVILSTGTIIANWYSIEGMELFDFKIPSEDCVVPLEDGGCVMYNNSDTDERVPEDLKKKNIFDCDDFMNKIQLFMVKNMLLAKMFLI